MKVRTLAAVALVALAALSLVVPADAGTSTPTKAKPYTETAHGKYVGPHLVPSCRFRYYDGDVAFSQDEVRMTIECAVRRWPVLGGIELAKCIARRESGFNWDAANPRSSASGVYQFLDGTWTSTRSRLSDVVAAQELEADKLNARSSVLLAIRSAHGAGWGPWGGGCS